MHRSILRRPLAVVAALALPLALTAACGGSSSSAGDGGGSPATGGVTKVTVGVIPIVDVAPIYLGIKKGFFADQGLDLKLQTAQGGAAIVPAVMSNQYQFGFSNVTSLLLGSSQGLGLKIVASGNATTGDVKKDFGGVVVKANSPIKTAADLAGKKVAVNTLNNINSTTVNEAVRKAGGDPSGIKYVELNFPDVAAALDKGDIDAGQLVEPFLTQALDSGDRLVTSNYAVTDPHLEIGAYFTSAAYAAKNPKIVQEFTAAMNQSLQYADAHPDEARQILTTYTDIDAATLAKITLPRWPATIDRGAVQKLSDLAVQDGLYKKAPDLDSLLP
jgi:NitT/TauT family transport system substrate-binding protein